MRCCKVRRLNSQANVRDDAGSRNDGHRPHAVAICRRLLNSTDCRANGAPAQHHAWTGCGAADVTGCRPIARMLRLPLAPGFLNHLGPDQPIQPRPRRDDRRVDVLVAAGAARPGRRPRRSSSSATCGSSLRTRRTTPRPGGASRSARRRRRCPACRTPACSGRRGIRRGPRRPSESPWRSGTCRAATW